MTKRSSRNSAIKTPALAAALSMLSASLGVTVASPADAQAVPNYGKSQQLRTTSQNKVSTQMKANPNRSSHQIKFDGIDRSNQLKTNQVKSSNQFKMNQNKSSHQIKFDGIDG